MKTVESMLKKEQRRLEKIKKEAEKRMKSAPVGHLRIVKKKNQIEYYYSKENYGKGNKNGRYLRKQDWGLAKKIAQRDYDVLLLKQIEKRLSIVKAFVIRYAESDFKKMEGRINGYRKALIEPSFALDEEYVAHWQNVEYQGKRIQEGVKEIITEKGEKVRSKSEKIIADKLYMLGIPYRYEYPLVLDGNFKIYPDFTILKMPEREEVYLEHLGMLDDEGYRNKVLYKMDTYERNGIYLGDKLFVTHETSHIPLNTRSLDCMLKAWFIAEKE